MCLVLTPSLAVDVLVLSVQSTVYDMFLEPQPGLHSQFFLFLFDAHPNATGLTIPHNYRGKSMIETAQIIVSVSSSFLLMNLIVFLWFSYV